MRNIFSRNKALRPVFSGLARKAAVFGLAVAAMATALLPGTAKAEWPERPITLVVMYGAGGGTDTIIRALATEMANATGWTINVINKPGAVGGVATKYVLNKPADGYTLLGAANYNKFVRVMGHSESKAWEDWQYFQAANSVASWSVRPDSPYQTFEDAIAAARQNPGKVSISTSGTGGLWQELALIVSEAAGVKLKYIPYKGGKAATLAGLQGEVDIAGGGLHEHIEFIRAGKLRNLQHTAPENIDDAKGGHLRSVGDANPSLKSKLPVGATYNVGVKRDTPVEVLKKIEKAFVAAANSASFKGLMTKKFYTLNIATGAEADRRAAMLETMTAATFFNTQDQIGKQVKSPDELGLPKPNDFDTWWPPKGYQPRM
jgi:tripartite-type tricarboxylate transporter receptor subunit TctC